MKQIRSKIQLDKLFRETKIQIWKSKHAKWRIYDTVTNRIIRIINPANILEHKIGLNKYGKFR